MALTVQCAVYSDPAACTRPTDLSAAGPAWHQSVTACPHADWHGLLCNGNGCSRRHREGPTGQVLGQWNQPYTLADDR